jgi:sporulation protein YlmC with PRC-barrel domain
MNTLHRPKLAALALVSAFALSGPLFAQAPQGNVPPLTAAQLAMYDVRASEVIGKEVKDPRGEELGHIEDMVLDVATSRVRYAVLSYGGFLGFGSRFAAFPLSLFRPAPQEGELLLDVERDALERAPAFDVNAWPDWNEGSYRTEVDRFFFQQDELLTTPAGGRLTRASDVIGKRVSDSGSRRAGHLEDLVVNLGNGQIRYAVLNFGRAWSLDNKLVALPLTAFHFPTRPDLDIFLTIERERVDMARAFDPGAWPDLNSARHRKDMEAYLSQFGQGGRAPAASGREAGPASGASN